MVTADVTNTPLGPVMVDVMTTGPVADTAVPVTVPLSLPGVVAITAVLEPDALAGAVAEAAEEVALTEAEDDEELDEETLFLHERLYRGAALKSDPTTPNDGLAGAS